jgi:signal transduction histidine kinase
MAPHGKLTTSKFELRSPPAGIRFRTDPVRLSQILQNLIANADRHTTEGHVTLVAEVRGEVLRCEVTDTGVGIAPEWLEQVFEPFARGPGGGRAGLGLALVRHLADALGGNAQLRSELGKGTTVVVSLHALAPSSA